MFNLITRGIPNQALGKVLAYAFAFFGMAAALFGTGNMAQSNTIARTFAEAVRSLIGIETPLWIPGLLITAAVGLVLVGGIRRIASVAVRLVPAMIVLYLFIAALDIILNLTEVPGVISLIVSNAFNPAAAVGGGDRVRAPHR